MKATISKIEHFDRKSDGTPISKISFEPTVINDEVVFLNPRWSDGHLDKKLEGKIARVV